jgi:alpha-1,3-rhamnosyl/mannosyltransferase
LVITLHDVAPFLFPELFPRRKGSYLRMVFSRVVAVAQIILADTEWQAQKIGEVFPVAGHKIQVLPLTVDPIFTKEAPSQTGRALCPETRERPFFLSVGTLEPRKNIPRLIDAWQHLDIDCDLVMVGRWGWRVSEIQHRLRTGGKYQLLPQGESWLFPSGNRIIRYEYLPAEDLTSLYHTAVGLVYPSLFEGFGLPVLEAMSCGCPVVTSQDSAMAEVAQEAAWLCDPLDEDSLGEAMCRLNSDWVEREKKKRSGLKRAQQFSQEKFAASLLTVYHSILDEGFA